MGEFLPLPLHEGKLPKVDLAKPDMGGQPPPLLYPLQFSSLSFWPTADWQTIWKKMQICVLRPHFCSPTEVAPESACPRFRVEWHPIPKLSSLIGHLWEVGGSWGPQGGQSPGLLLAHPPPPTKLETEALQSSASSHPRGSDNSQLLLPFKPALGGLPFYSQELFKVLLKSGLSWGKEAAVLLLRQMTFSPHPDCSLTCDQSPCHLKTPWGTSLMVQWLRLHIPNAGGPGLIPGRGTRSHMPQLRVCMLQRRSKIPCAATKTRPSKKKKKRVSKNKYLKREKLLEIKHLSVNMNPNLF